MAYLLLMMGANLPNSLQPVYTAALGLDAFTQAALFSTYIGSMTVVLVILGMIHNAWSARVLLVASLVTSTTASLLMLLASEHVLFIFGARLLSGIALGFGTGAASAIALKHLGETARTTIASGAVFGSLIGNVGAGIFATYLPAPTALPYIVHATLTGVILLMLIIASCQPTAQRAPLYVRPQRQQTGNQYATRHMVAAYTVGGLAWFASGLVLSLTPSVVRQDNPESTLLAAILPAGLLLATGSLGQRLTRPMLGLLRAWHVVIPLTLGLCVFAIAIFIGSFPMLLIAGIITGLGQGPAYSLGLATVSANASPRQQGVRTSRYAAASYAMCAAGVTVFGVVATHTSLATSFLVAGAIAALLGGVAVIAAGPRQTIT